MSETVMPMARPDAEADRSLEAPQIRQEFVTIHGYRRAYRIAGSGPALLLIHGIGDDSSTWEEVMPELARHHTVIAPDLLGHGLSDKPRADYSVAAFANGMRDLLVVLGIYQVTVVGHSLGGGVAMQFCYQFPRFVDRLVLVAAGGVARDVSPALRAASLPLVPTIIAALRLPGLIPAIRAGVRRVAAISDIPGLPDRLTPRRLTHDHEDMIRVLDGLTDPRAHAAFLRTLRAVVDWRGQAVNALDRAYLTEHLPMLIVWGTDDQVIPYRHAQLAHSAIPHSRLSTYPGAGHFPFRDDPARFTRELIAFVDGTDPVLFDPVVWRSLMKQGVQPAEITGDDATVEAVLEVFDDERNAV